MNKFALSLSILALAVVSQANLIVNGDFEADPWATNTHSLLVSVTGWNINPVGNVAGTGHGYLGNVTRKLDLSGYSDGFGSGIHQTVTTVVGGSYVVSFEMYVPVSGTARLLINNATLASGIGNGTFTYAFAGTGSDKIEFISEGGITTHLDNVSVVPEPATFAILGLGALAAMRRRRAK